MVNISMGELLNEYMDGLCEIKSMDNQLLLIGYVCKVSGTIRACIDISAKDSAFQAKARHNLPVKMTFRKNGSFLVAGGKIFAATETFWRISHIIVYQNKERRGFFRVETQLPCRVAPYNTETSLVPDLQVNGNTLMNPADEVFIIAKLKDISLSGTKFYSEGMFEKGTSIKLSGLYLLEDHSPLSLVCKVIERMACPDEGYIYRCKLEDTSSGATSLLCKAIFNLERENAKRLK